MSIKVIPIRGKHIKEKYWYSTASSTDIFMVQVVKQTKQGQMLRTLIQLLKFDCYYLYFHDISRISRGIHILNDHGAVLEEVTLAGYRGADAQAVTYAILDIATGAEFDSIPSYLDSSDITADKDKISFEVIPFPYDE